jgi:hypothetical protein
MGHSFATSSQPARRNPAHQASAGGSEIFEIAIGGGSFLEGRNPRASDGSGFDGVGNLGYDFVEHDAERGCCRVAQHLGCLVNVG